MSISSTQFSAESPSSAFSAVTTRLVVADLAGTTIDFGSSAPAGVFVELFQRHGVEATAAEAREPMGTAKRDHIATMTRMPRIAEAWRAAHGTDCSEADIDRLYAEFIPLQLETLPQFDQLVPGTREMAEALAAAGIAVAVTTGYDHEMTRVVLDAAARQGFVPSVAVCASDVAAGRPAPWMIFRAMEKAGVYPPSAVVAVGDTIADIEAARNAGVRAVGVTATGNMLGLSLAEYEGLSEGDRGVRLATAREAMLAAGADAVIASVAELPSLLGV